jgi:ParB family transcriptional regulator, chromosome partitioning protein
MSRQALGKGLSALIPTQLRNMEESAAGGDRISQLPLNQIRPNPHQPRGNFSNHELKELADSIREQGLLQPIMVRRGVPSGYEIIAGERRFRAAQLLGLKHIPAILKENVSEEEVAEWSLIENVQRSDLNPIEEAKAYKRLMEEFGLSQEEVAKKVGKERATVANTVRLLKLPAEIQALVQSNKLSMGHARALLAIEKPEVQRALGHKASVEGWSVRQVEQEASERAGQSRGRNGKAPAFSPRRDIHLMSVEEEIRRALGTKVRIKPHKKGGCIEVEYYSQEDLERLMDIFRGKRR